MLTQTNIRKFALLLTLALSPGAITSHVLASLIPLSQTNSYTQNFDSLPNSGQSRFVLPGWAIQQLENQNSQGNQNNQDGGGMQIAADDGSSRLGGIYSYGPIGSQNRALGILTDASGNFAFFGANFQNSGLAPITRLNISYTGEEWRLGVEGHQNTLQFQYSLDAKNVSDPNATWLNAPALNFVTPNLTGVGAHDGTLAINQTQIASTISFLNIPSGGTFWIRWQEVGVGQNTNGDGLAVDNFSISAVPEASTILAGVGTLGLVAAAILRPRARTVATKVGGQRSTA